MRIEGLTTAYVPQFVGTEIVGYSAKLRGAFGLSGLLSRDTLSRATSDKELYKISLPKRAQQTADAKPAGISQSDLSAHAAKATTRNEWALIQALISHHYQFMRV